VTPDIPRAMRFYTELLGWELTRETYGEFAYPRIRCRGDDHGGFLPIERYGGELPHWLAYVLVDEVDEATSRAEESGGSVRVPPTNAGQFGRFAILVDPQGAAIALISAFVPEHPAGVFIWDELMTSDVQGAEAFYERLLGWDCNIAHIGPSGPYRFFKLGEADVGGLMEKLAYLAEPTWLPYLSVEDVDATARRADELGATLAVSPTQIVDIGRYAIAADPLGALFGIYRPD
jgi:predicted enzyme related to lactoylglutathione lyase